MKLTAALLGAAFAASGVALAIPAQAAPINAQAPQAGTPLAVTCPGLGTVQVVSPPGSDHANFTPGFVVGTHQVAVPYSFHFVVSAGGSVVQEQTVAKNAPVPADALTCQIAPDSFVDQGQTVTFSGTVVAALHGKP